MFLIQRENPQSPSSIAYFMGCVGQGKSIAVDVHLDDIDWFVEQAQLKDVSITYVIDTHVHADHYSGANELVKRTGASYLMHESSKSKSEFISLKDQQLIHAGNVEVKIIHTPGHTLDSICLLVTDNSRAPLPWFLLSQHTLFVGSVGRPDLRGQEDKMAGLLFDSLHQKLLSLPDYIEILPGAKAGSACGTGISAKPTSTIGFERKANPSLSLSKSKFIQHILADLPPLPKSMDKIVAANMS